MRSRAWPAIALALVSLGCGADGVVAPPPAAPPPPPAAGPSVATIEIPEVAELLPGDSRLLTVVVKDSVGTVLDLPLTWTTSNPSVASAASLGGRRGSVIALATGTTTVTVSVGTVRASRVVTVNDPTPATLTINVPAMELVVGGQFAVPVVIQNAIGKALPVRAVIWSSSDPQTVTVSASGIVTAVALGSTEITATVNGIVAHLRVTTTPAAILIQPNDAQLAIGDSVQLKAVAVATNGRVIATDFPVVWQSDHPEWVRIDSRGWAYGVASNLDDVFSFATITATAIGATGRGAAHVLSFRGGQPSGVRFVHAAKETGDLTFVTTRGASVMLKYGEQSDQPLTSGILNVSILGFPPATGIGMQTWNGALYPAQHTTIYAAAGDPYGFLFSSYDLHRPVSPGEVLLRLVMASDYLRTWAGIDVFVEEPDAPTGEAMLGNFMEIGSVTDYTSRAVGSYDVVLKDGMVNGVRPGLPGAELARFRITPQPGKATSYVITGNGPGTFSLLTVVDP